MAQAGNSKLPVNPACDAWVKDVLGIDLQAPAADDPAAGLSAQYMLTVWGNAKSAADSQLDALCTQLRELEDEVFAEVADEIEVALDDYNEWLMGALQEFQRSPAARDKTLQVLQTAGSKMAKDKYLAAADTNPFGVKTSLRSTLGGAIAAMTEELA